jgi:hypothetical protein
LTAAAVRYLERALSIEVQRFRHRNADGIVDVRRRVSDPFSFAERVAGGSGSQESPRTILLAANQVVLKFVPPHAGIRWRRTIRDPLGPLLSIHVMDANALGLNDPTGALFT